MKWILLDLAIALPALTVLGILLLRLWRRVKALSRAVGQATKLVGEATEALAAAQGDGPLGRPAATTRAAPGTRERPAAPDRGRSLGASSRRRGARP